MSRKMKHLKSFLESRRLKIPYHGEDPIEKLMHELPDKADDVTGGASQVGNGTIWITIGGTPYSFIRLGRSNNFVIYDDVTELDVKQCSVEGVLDFVKNAMAVAKHNLA